MRRPSTKVVALGLLLAALVCAGVVSRYASSDPDGLTKVSQDKGFDSTEVVHHSGWLDYGSVSGIVGVLVVLVLAGALTLALRRRGSSDTETQAHEDSSV